MNCILTGVGGQGTILAAKLIANTAMAKGLQARTAETIGMAQRGGSVISHVRIGEEVYSPLIPEKTADLLIGFEPAEAVRALRYLKKDGTVIVSKTAIKPAGASLNEKDYDVSKVLAYLQERIGKVIFVDTDSICRKCGSAKVLNVVLLGVAAASGTLGFTVEELEETLHRMLPERNLAVNLKALQEARIFAADCPI